MKIIEVTFDDAGEPKVETTGFSGGECAKITKPLEDALGSVVSDTKKAEYHAQGSAVSSQQKAGS